MTCYGRGKREESRLDLSSAICEASKDISAMFGRKEFFDSGSKMIQLRNVFFTFHHYDRSRVSESFVTSRDGKKMEIANR